LKRNLGIFFKTTKIPEVALQNKKKKRKENKSILLANGEKNRLHVLLLKSIKQLFLDSPAVCQSACSLNQ
jgi:hypothetical protein